MDSWRSGRVELSYVVCMRRDGRGYVTTELCDSRDRACDPPGTSHIPRDALELGLLTSWQPYCEADSRRSADAEPPAFVMVMGIRPAFTALILSRARSSVAFVMSQI